MEKQKKIALINDLTGFGRCSTAVMAPIVSAMKIQAVAVPTAILSAHTQFPTYYFDDYTDRMKDYIQTYKDLKLDFDAISTGFLGSEQQVDIVLDFIRHFKTDRNFVIVDPVMGDYGKLYRTSSNISVDICFAAKLIAQFKIFMCSKAIILSHTAPVGIDHLLSAFLRTNTIHPMILISKTAARPAKYRNLNFL